MEWTYWVLLGRGESRLSHKALTRIPRVLIPNNYHGRRRFTRFETTNIGGDKHTKERCDTYDNTTNIH
jgi:hypothetical protein